MDLMTASHQWSKRPDDERFWGIPDLLAATRKLRAECSTAMVRIQDLSVEVVNREPMLVGKRGAPASFTHSGFGQISSLVGAPASYLRTLQPELAASCLQAGLASRSGDLALLLHGNPSAHSVHAVTSQRYQRVWDSEIVESLEPLLDQGWRTPPARPAPGSTDPRIRPATQADVLDSQGMLSIQIGDMIGPAGAYFGQGAPSLFVMLVQEGVAAESGDRTLNQFALISHDVTGKGALRLTGGLYDHVCGNHILWGARTTRSMSIRHLGHRARNKIQGAVVQNLTSESQSYDQLIASARDHILGTGKLDTVDALYQRRITSRKNLDLAYGVAERNEDAYGAPTTAWGMSSGLQEVAQRSPYADQRHVIDVAASRVLDLAG